jgi:enamine deaminase RidA (YjgF/YER057c/UK114 family)
MHMNTFYNPPGLATPNGFSHVAETRARRTLIVSGQVAYDASGSVVGAGDLHAQTRQVYANIQAALASRGATMDDLVKTTLCVRDRDPEKAAVVRRARQPFLPAEHPCASTMVGVASLARPDLLLEVEAIAMTD